MIKMAAKSGDSRAIEYICKDASSVGVPMWAEREKGVQLRSSRTFERTAWRTNEKRKGSR